MRRFFFILAIALGLAFSAHAQDPKKEPAKAPKQITSSRKDQTETQLEIERAARERRAQVRSLLISLASDARNFRDQTLRARVQARIADALWDVDAEQSRGLFRKAWEAAEVADKEAQQRLQDEVREQKAKSGGFAVMTPPNLRGEVLKLAAKHDRALGEEFLEKLKEEKQRDALDNNGRDRRDPMSSPDSIRQRLTLAQQLLDSGAIEQALQFADPVLGTVTMSAVNFLSFLRDKDAAGADRRYAVMLANAEGDPQSDANTVSLLSSYLLTPHTFITVGNAGTSISFTARKTAPPDVAPDLRFAFLRSAASILMRPLPPPEQDQTTSGRQGKYLIVKRLLPYFIQYAPREMADTMRAQLDLMAAALPADAPKFGDEVVNLGVGPEPKSEDREQLLKDRFDHAKTADERDELYMEMAQLLAGKADMTARDFVDKIDDSETRKQARAYIDMTLALETITKKDIEGALEISRIGELTHLQRAWVLTQAARLLVSTDRDKALALIEQAAEEARRIDGSDADKPRALMAVASAFILADRPRGWDAVLDAVKAANSAEGYSGEDGQLVIKFQVNRSSSIRSSSAEEFDVTKAFRDLASEDYARAVQLAGGFQADAPRASATIAIARAVLDAKTPESKPAKRAAGPN